MLSTLSSTLAVLVVIAQVRHGNAQSSSSATTTSSASGTVHTVTVGEDASGSPGLVYTPNDFTAAAGDMVMFKFVNGFHTATEGDFNNACQPANSSSFYSGEVSSPSGTFTITVNSTDAIYFYCSTPGHCQAGMAGAINAPSGQSAADYVAASKKTSSSSSPPQVQGGVLGSGGASSNSSSSSSSSSSASASASSSATGSSSASGSASMTSASGSASMTSSSASASASATKSSAAAPLLSTDSWGVMGGVFAVLAYFL